MATYYVSTTGDDGNAGSSIAPWATFAKANAAISANDTVRIAPGTYYEALVITKAGTTWRVDGDGSSPVILAGRYNYSTASPGPGGEQLQNSLYVSQSVVKGQYSAMVRIEADDVVVDGIAKYGIIIRDSGGRFINVKKNVDGATVRYVRGDFAYYNSIRGEYITNFTLEHCAFTRTAMMNWGPERNNRGNRITPSSIIFINSQDIVIRDVYLAWAAGEGIWASVGSNRFTIEDCEVMGMGHAHIYVNGCKNAVVRRNVVWSDPLISDGLTSVTDKGAKRVSNGIAIADEAHNVASENPKFYNNLIVGCKDGFQMRGNTDPTKPNYLYPATDAYFGYNTVIGYRPPNTDPNVGGRELLNVQMTLNGAHKGIIENNVFLYMDGQVPALDSPIGVMNGTHPNLIIRNNVWYKAPPTKLRGTNDVYETPILANQKYTLPRTYYNQEARKSTSLWGIVSLKDDLSWAELIPSTQAIGHAARGSVGGFTPPAGVTTDYNGDSRGTDPDCGFIEFDGTPSDPIDTLTASFTQSATSGVAPLSVTFTDTSTSSGTVNSWLYEFGDGGSSTSQNPTRIYTTPGVYTPTLTARDTNGLEDTYTGSTIVVQQPAPGDPTDGSYAIAEFVAPTEGDGGVITLADMGTAQPTAAIFVMVGATAKETVTDGGLMSIGYSTGAGAENNFAWVGYAQDGQAASNTGHRTEKNAVLVATDTTGAIVGSMVVTGFGPGTISYTCTDAFPAGYRCAVFAISGGTAQIANNAPVSSGQTQLMGVPGASVAMVLDGWRALATANDSLDVSLGAANGTTQYSYMWHDRDGADPTYLHAATASNGTVGRALADGFTIAIDNLATAPAITTTGGNSTTTTSPLMLRLSADVSTDLSQQTSPPSPATQGYDLDFTPGGLILWGGLNASAGGNAKINTRASALWIGFVTATKSAFFCMSSEAQAATSNTQVWTGEDLEVYRGGNTKVLDADVALTSGAWNAVYNTTSEITFNVLAFEQGTVSAGDPVVDFELNPATGYVGDQFYFYSTTNANGNTIVSYTWEFADEVETNELGIHYWFATEPGTFDVTLTVTLDDDSTFSRTKTGALIVQGTTADNVYIQGPFEPHPAGVNYDTPTYIGLIPNLDGDSPDPYGMEGYHSHQQTTTDLRLAYTPEDTTTAYPGKVRMVYDDTTGNLKLIRPDGATASLSLTWSGGGGTGGTPPAAPTLNAISNGDADGSYTVDWDAVSGAESYTLQERLGSGVWATIYTGSATDYAVSGNADGTWGYRVSATDTDSGLTSVYSSIQTTTVSTGGPVTATYGPTASNHDAWQAFDSTVDIDDVRLQLDGTGKWAGLYVDASADVASLGGATVSSAYLKYYPVNTTQADPDIVWYGENVDTAAVFDTTTNSIRARKNATPTTATAADTGTGVGIGVRSIDVTSIIQEIVNRAGWTGPIVLLGDAQEGSNIRMYAYDNGSSIWSLEVTYTP